MSESTRESDDADKSEHLYQLARDAYSTAERRFDDAEAKIGRYLSILFVVLGLSTIGADKLRTIVSVGQPSNIAFGVLIALFYFCGLISFVYFVRALRVQQVRALKLGNPVSAYFRKYRLPAALDGLADAFFAASAQFRNRTQEKLRLAHRGFTILLVAVGLAVAAACSYLFVETPKEPAMTHPANGGGGGSSESQESTPEPASEASDDSTQAAEDASQLFEDLQKSFEGGETREKK